MILRSMTPKFNFVVCSIEEYKDIDVMSIDELKSSFLAHEQKINQHDREEQALKASTNGNPSKGDGGRGRDHWKNDCRNS